MVMCGWYVKGEDGNDGILTGKGSRFWAVNGRDSALRSVWLFASGTRSNSAFTRKGRGKNV